MNFLFINKPISIEPLGIMYLSSVIKNSGHNSDLALTTENLEKKLETFKPDFVGYSIMTGDQDFYDKINRDLKSKFKFFSIAGGPHPTFFPEFLQSSSFDAICRGEGDLAIKQFLSNPESLETSNFWFKKEDNSLIKNPVQSLVENLDEIPFPDREIVFQYPEIKGGPIKHFIASRGCPFDCSYCFNKSFSELYDGKGRRVRFKSVDNTVKEINEVIQKAPTKFIYFQDDTFTLNSQWLSEFAEKYSKKVGMPFHCHVRPNTITEEKIKSLKDAGCYSVHIAAESGNDSLRNKILNRNMTREQIVLASELLKKYDIKFMMQNIIGIPEGNLQTDLETLELNIECKPDYAWVSIFQPYPGTRLGKFCKEKGYYIGDFKDLDSNFFNSSKLNFPEEYKLQLANLQKLFAVFVEYPDLYKVGLSDILINEPPTEKTKQAYQEIYKKFRKLGDKKLYGFDL